MERPKGLSNALMDRLLLNEERIGSMIGGLEAIANQNDPIGASHGGMETPEWS